MLIIKNIKELAVCPGGKNNAPVTGKDLSSVGLIRNASVAIEDGAFIRVGTNEEIASAYEGKCGIRTIDASGMVALPGFVDCHTHAVFAGSRADEYGAKVRGESYADIHKKGRGIHYTVGETRKSEEEYLYRSSASILREMLFKGTLTIEIKSGYGLSVPDELKILRVIQRLKRSEKQDIAATFLGAHTIPKEYASNRSAYVSLVIDKMIPTVWEYDLADCVDVFCDPLGFTPEETGKICAAAREYGFELHIHGEQTAHYGGAKVAAEYYALSLDHGDYLDEEDIALLKESETAVVVFPGVLMHGMEWGKTRLPETVLKLRAAEVPIALATDFNPGSAPITSMKLVMDLGMRMFRLGFEETLNMATINAAGALGMSRSIGSVEAGKQADLLLIKAYSVEDYLYRIGDRPFDYIVKKGEIVSK